MLYEWGKPKDVRDKMKKAKQSKLQEATTSPEVSWMNSHFSRSWNQTDVMKIAKLVKNGISRQIYRLVQSTTPLEAERIYA